MRHDRHPCSRRCGRQSGDSLRRATCSRARARRATSARAAQKRVLLYGEWIQGNVREPVAHRQYVFTLPRLLRPHFGQHRPWLGELCRIAARLLVDAYAEGRKKLAGYMVRAPMSLEKMRYDLNTETVIYRSKMHLGLKRNFRGGPGWPRSPAGL